MKVVLEIQELMGKCSSPRLETRLSLIDRFVGGQISLSVLISSQAGQR